MAIGFLVFTISTLTPLDNIGVMTMKMISITSITSTMGVTLMSATGGGALSFNSGLSVLIPVIGIGLSPESGHVIWGDLRGEAPLQLAGSILS